MLPLQRLLCLIFDATVSDTVQDVVCGAAVLYCMNIFSVPNIFFVSCRYRLGSLYQIKLAHSSIITNVLVHEQQHIKYWRHREK